MSKVFSSSYTNEQAKLITCLVKAVNPKLVVEIGVQQARSSIAICKGMNKNSKFIGYDLFEETYSDPPYANTHANCQIATQNMVEAKLKCDWVLTIDDHTEACNIPNIDLLHVDICNHYNNLEPVVESVFCQVSKMIILEGGIENNWQKKLGFKPYLPLVKKFTKAVDWTYITIPFNQHNAITILTPKEYK